MDIERELTFGMLTLKEGDQSGLNIIKQYADAEEPLALTYLGLCYDTGLGVEKDSQKAFDLYVKSMDLGCDAAIAYVAESYYLGSVVKQDKEKAFELLNTGCYERHNGTCLAMLGRIYFVERKIKEAIPLLQESVDKENVGAVELLAMCYADRKYGNKELALKYFLMAADLRMPLSAFNIGCSYMEGTNGLEQSDEKGLHYLEIAASEGVVKAMGAVGSMYTLGIGTKEDKTKAAYWFLKGAENNDVDCMYHIGLTYLLFHDELHVKYEDAVKWLEKSADHGDTRAYEHLAFIYEKGIGVEIDKEKAASYKAKCRISKCFGNKNLKN